ncbi:hypothetical protein B296_00023036 [Ensete ventricosum]|uniref:Uncharacterized protein n=1 Tax=Ensete ventricosum TaxID=4639 RepID=A0A426XCB1_ENSVE|nr:hypothetical protein B296_00023036 [Ensete ventricosum]
MLPLPSPTLYRSRTNLLPLSFPHCSDVSHTIAVFRSNRSGSASTTLLFLNRMIIPHRVSASPIHIFLLQLPTLIAWHSLQLPQPRDLAAPPTPPPLLPSLPLLRHRSSHLEAISLLNHRHISSSLPPPLLLLPAPASLLPSRYCYSPKQGSATLPEPSLAVHSSVTATFDRHILLKGRRLYCLAYHSIAFSRSNCAFLYRSHYLDPTTLYLSFNLLLSSSPTAATTTFFSPPAATIVAQLVLDSLGLLQP